MKKIICLIITLVVFVCLIASCAQTATTVTTQTSITTKATVEPIKITASKYTLSEYLDDSTGGEIITEFHQGVPKKEVNEKNNPYTDAEKVGTTKELKVAGETYQLQYKQSDESGYYNNVILHTYTDGTITAKFTDNLDKCVYVDGIPKKSNDKLIDREEAIQRAYAFFRGYVEELDGYYLEADGEKNDGGYFVHFYRYIEHNQYFGDIKTNEGVEVIVNSDGTIGGYRLQNVDMFYGVDISEIDMKKIDNMIKEKTDKTYEGYTYEITRNDCYILRNKDGSFEFNFTLHVNVSGKEFTTPVPDEMFLLITLE